MTQRSRDSLNAIAKAINVGSYGSVSRVVNRTSSQLQSDSRLKKSYRLIYSSLIMIQAKTLWAFKPHELFELEESDKTS